MEYSKIGHNRVEQSRSESGGVLYSRVKKMYSRVLHNRVVWTRADMFTTTV
jgi:hypothetical protein